MDLGKTNRKNLRKKKKHPNIIQSTELNDEQKQLIGTENTGSGNYHDDIPVSENVVNYHTMKTAGEEGKEIALNDNRDTRNPKEE